MHWGLRLVALAPPVVRGAVAKALSVQALAAAADVRYAQAKAVARLVDVTVHGRLDEQKEASRFADQALTAATKLLGISHSLTVALAYKAASIKLEMDEVNAAQHTMESVKSAIRGRPADMVGANCLQEESIQYFLAAFLRGLSKRLAFGVAELDHVPGLRARQPLPASNVFEWERRLWVKKCYGP